MGGILKSVFNILARFVFSLSSFSKSSSVNPASAGGEASFGVNSLVANIFFVTIGKLHPSPSLPFSHSDLAPGTVDIFALGKLILVDPGRSAHSPSPFVFVLKK